MNPIPLRSRVGRGGWLRKRRRAHVPDCPHALSLPVDLCACGRRPESDAEWRRRWHARLGRGAVETEGRFYKRIEAFLSNR